MVDEKNNAEPSVEEILSSIRKIIADDKDVVEAKNDDVIELTDVVEEPKDVVANKVSSPVKNVSAKDGVVASATDIKHNNNMNINFDSFDEMVEKITVPLIQKWLDENLQTIVEYQVAKEIEKRFSKKAK